MIRRNNWFLIGIVIIFALALWVLFPIESERFGREGIQFGLDLEGGVRLVYQADFPPDTPDSEKDGLIDGVAKIISNRVNPLGVTEPYIEQRGDDQIVVELPNLSITDVQKGRIGRTALLEFREYKAITIGGDEEPVGEEEEEEEPVGEEEEEEEPVGEEEEEEEPVGEEEEEEENGDGTDIETIMMWVPATGMIDGEERVLNSSYFVRNTYVATSSQQGGVALHFEWDEEGAILSEQITGRLIGKQLAIFEGSGEDAQPLFGEDGNMIAPTVNDVITDAGIITGLSLKEATELSRQLNAGRLEVPLTLIGEIDIDPTLGEDFVDLSLKAGIIGIVLVMFFMIAYYRLPGLLASLALIFYGVLVLAIFKLVPVTLTLAGIGGFVLSLGMAVDANVLIFERMKEELRRGRTLGAAIETGFNRAWTAIRDSNITTMIVCVILIVVGSNIPFGGSVQGFGLTLLIGVAVSMLTAIIVTRTLLRLLVGTNLAKRSRLFSMYSGRQDV
ncbi:MAG TPA: protein translocase subunit SecD [Dehalococcoidia bacterium]|nr:protein translocase subunit SecD [Dehalococcoidia bacterium]